MRARQWRSPASPSPGDANSTDSTTNTSSTATRDPEPLCDGVHGNYTVSTHIVAVWVLLLSSAVGAGFPLLGRRLSWLNVPEYVFLFGKSMGTGVMIAVGFVHLLGEANAHFALWCVPDAFFNAYPSWALAFAVLAVMAMHTVDLVIGEWVEHWYAAAEDKAPDAHPFSVAPSAVRHQGDADAEKEEEEVNALLGAKWLESPGLDPLFAGMTAVTIHPMDPVPVEETPCRERDEEETKRSLHFRHSPSSSSSPREQPCPPRSPKPSGMATPAVVDPAEEVETEDGRTAAPEAGAGRDEMQQLDGTATPVGPPREGGREKSKAQFVVAAICMEFGTTLHSVFVGLDVGVMSDTKIKPMLVALIFHQLLEGLAMGSRIADASFLMSLEMAMMWMFACSAPLGALGGTLAVHYASGTALAGPSYVLVSSILDAMCGGILVYLGLTLMVGDFPRDLQRVRDVEQNGIAPHAHAHHQPLPPYHTFPTRRSGSPATEQTPSPPTVPQHPESVRPTEMLCGRRTCSHSLPGQEDPHGGPGVEAMEIIEATDDEDQQRRRRIWRKQLGLWAALWIGAGVPIMPPRAAERASKRSGAALSTQRYSTLERATLQRRTRVAHRRRGTDAAQEDTRREATGVRRLLLRGSTLEGQQSLLNGETTASTTRRRQGAAARAAVCLQCRLDMRVWPFCGLSGEPHREVESETPPLASPGGELP